MITALVLAQAPTPGPVTVNFDTIGITWLFWITLGVFVLLATVGKKKWAWGAAATMVGTAIGYALFLAYVLPFFTTG